MTLWVYVQEPILWPFERTIKDKQTKKQILSYLRFIERTEIKLKFPDTADQCNLEMETHLEQLIQ